MKRLLLTLLALSATSAYAQDVSLPEFERVALDNGTVLLLAEKHDLPLIAMQAVVRGGTVADPAGSEGLTALLATLMQKGAGDRDAAEFAEAAAAVGGSIGVGASREYVAVSADFLSRDAELMIELVADTLMRPILDADEFTKEQQRSIAMIQSAKSGNPRTLLGAYGNAFLYGDHVYAHSTFGSETSLEAITHASLLEHYETSFGGDRLIISVVGDFDTAAMQARLTQVFGSWPAATAALPEVAAPERIEGKRVLLVDKPGSAQTYFWIGNLSVPLDYPQRAELEIANTLFGGRFTSMLNTALRVESGLTYGARSRVDQLVAGGTATIRSYTQTGSTVEAIDLAVDVLSSLHTRGVDEEMIASARNYIMGQYPPSLETVSSLAGMLAWLEAQGLERAYIDEYGAALAEVTPVSAHNTISDVYPVSDDLVVILIGDAEAIREDVQKYGPVTEVSITEPHFGPYQ